MRRQASAPADGKTASISVFLLEELGDARVRCEQLKKYVDEATALIEKSPHRDHFFEVAGHLLHGIPETLFKMEKALEAASMAASRIDYEEIKERLKPEKVEELEKALQDVRIRRPQRRSDGNPGAPETEMTTGKQAQSKEEFEKALKVDEAMLAKYKKDLEKLKKGEAVENLTLQGAEGVIKGLEAVIQNKKHLLTKLATGQGAEGAMNGKIAATELVRIAEQTERTGVVPIDRLVSLIARLERGKRQASASGADPQKVGGYFRAMAEHLVASGNETDPAKKPSRFALARALRNVVADQMPMTSAQVAAQIYQQANSREDVMKGFKESNPDMSQADLEKAADMWEKHKDVVKDIHQEQQ